MLRFIQHDTEKQMTEILFGQSYFLRFDPKLWEAMQPYPPLGTMIAANMVRQQGYDVALFDAMLAESTTEWQAALIEQQPRIAIIYEDNFNYLSKMCLLNMREAAFEMLQMAKEANCLTIICGSDATDHFEQYLEQGADFVILGEGEATLTELLQEIGDYQPAAESIEIEQKISNLQSPISSLAYQTPNGPISTPRRPPIQAVDNLPFPAWDLIDVERYRRIWIAKHGYYSMNMVTTRGCPYHCNWCAKPIWGQRYNSRSPQKVAEELQWLKETYQPDHIWFADDIMGLKPNWWATFAAEVEKRKAQTPFKCLSRADLLLRSDAEIHAMRRAGCDIVWIGAESGSQKILNGMEKGTTVEQIYEATKMLHDAGIRVGFFLQFGYPGETAVDVEKTLQMVRDCRPDDVGMSVSYPLPGTKFHQSVQRHLGEKQNWDDSADLAMLYQGPFSTEYYRQLHLVLHKEFRSRKAWQQWQKVAFHPKQWKAHHFRELIASVYRLASLPGARRRLQQLADASPAGIELEQAMSLAEAAQPSPQPNEVLHEPN